MSFLKANQKARKETKIKNLRARSLIQFECWSNEVLVKVQNLEAFLRFSEMIGSFW